MLAEVTDIIGLIAFSISGFVVALKARLDLLGVLIAAFCTALVGGLMRDTIAGVDPYVFTSLKPGIIVISTVALLIIFRKNIKNILRFEKSRFFIVADSIGLISFAHTGALVAIDVGFNLFGVVLCSFITAVGGGLVRDVIINEVPFFMKSDFYAVIPLFIGCFLYILNSFELLQSSFLVLSLAGFLLLRLFAYKYRWSLPVFEIN